MRTLCSIVIIFISALFLNFVQVRPTAAKVGRNMRPVTSMKLFDFFMAIAHRREFVGKKDKWFIVQTTDLHDYFLQACFLSVNITNEIPWNIASLWVLIIHALDGACHKYRGRVADLIHRSAINSMRQCVNINTTVYLIVCLDTQTGVWCHLLSIHTSDGMLPSKRTQLARFMGQTWGASGADRTQVGPMLAPWTLLSGDVFNGDRPINVLQNTLSYMHIVLLDFSLLRLNCRFCCKIIYMSHSYSSGLVFFTLGMSLTYYLKAETISNLFSRSV